MIDRRRIDKIINFYHPLFELEKFQYQSKLHLKTLGQFVDYANLFTKVKNWNRNNYLEVFYQHHPIHLQALGD